MNKAIDPNRIVSTNHNETLKVTATVKAGGIHLNHNDSLKIATAVKAGGIHLNHNATLTVAAKVRAGGMVNHNETLRS